MPRPVKKRIVCMEPKTNIFGPPSDNIGSYIFMNLEEFEAIRLIDYEGLTQDECSKLMNVARTTVQKIYVDARTKIADALVNGKTLKIEGGNYNLCTQTTVGKGCNRKNCHRMSKNCPLLDNQRAKG